MVDLSRAASNRRRKRKHDDSVEEQGMENCNRTCPYCGSDPYQDRNATSLCKVTGNKHHREYLLAGPFSSSECWTGIMRNLESKCTTRFYDCKYCGENGRHCSYHNWNGCCGEVCELAAKANPERSLSYSSQRPSLTKGSSHALAPRVQDTKHFMWTGQYRCELCRQVFPHWSFLTKLAASDTFDSEGTTLDAFETCKTCNEEVQGLLQAGYLLEVEDA